MIAGREISMHPGLEDLSLKNKTRAMAELDVFINGADDSMVDLERSSFADVDGIEPMPTFETGFVPLDIALGGVYEGVLLIAAKPGVGKTSTMLAMSECIKRTHPDWNICFFEQEFSRNLAIARMKGIYERGNPFGKRDLLVTGGTSIEEIMDELKARDKRFKRPEKRVVFIDSPDTMPGLGAENRRFELGHVYRKCVRIKEQPQTQLVVVASQLNRKKGGPALDKLAESSDKSWLTDMVVVLTKAGHNRMKMQVIKNRFGPPDQAVIYHFNMEKLISEESELEDMQDWG